MTGTGLQANAPCNKYHFVSRASDFMLTHFQLFSEVSILCILTHRVNSYSCMRDLWQQMVMSVDKTADWTWSQLIMP